MSGMSVATSSDDGAVAAGNAVTTVASPPLGLLSTWPAGGRGSLATATVACVAAGVSAGSLTFSAATGAGGAGATGAASGLSTGAGQRGSEVDTGRVQQRGGHCGGLVYRGRAAGIRGRHRTCTAEGRALRRACLQGQADTGRLWQRGGLCGGLQGQEQGWATGAGQRGLQPSQTGTVMHGERCPRPRDVQHNFHVSGRSMAARMSSQRTTTEFPNFSLFYVLGLLLYIKRSQIT